MSARAWLAALLLPALGSCMQGRAEALERRIETLRAEVQRLDAETSKMVKIMSRGGPPTQAVRVDNDPAGFSLDRALPAGHPSKPDVILLSVDTLRADHLGAYGYARDTSPFFDELAASGTLFEQAWSPSPWTLPSHTTMLSGLLPAHHGAIEDHLRIPAAVPLVQEAFQQAGYGTSGTVATLFVSSKFGFDRGFDHFEDFGIKTKAANNLSTVDADHVFHHALNWAQQQPAGKPLFAFVHVYDVHYGYDAPAPYNIKFDRAPEWGDEKYKNYWAYKKRMVNQPQLQHQIAQYDEEIAFTDAMFRELVETWRRSGRDLIVAVTADHGEEFGERGSWGHGHTLWPEQLHVPLIVNGPGVANQRVSQRVGTEDIAPTLAALAGVPFRADDGRSAALAIRSGSAASVAGPAAELADTSRFDSLVLRWHASPYDLYIDMARRERSLCNVRDDPKCTKNLYRERRPEAEALFSDMTRWIGEPWVVEAPGKISVNGGAVLQGGERRPPADWTVSPGDRFGVFPGDAIVRFTNAAGDQTLTWRPMGGPVPGEGCPVRFEGHYTIDSELPTATAEERAMLEELGYLQGDDDGDESGAPSGPQPCH